MAFLTRKELENLGFKHLGNNVLISEKVSIYNSSGIEIGDNVRIDDFCILSAGEGGIKLGSFVHIACYVSLIGKGLIEVDDFAGISSRTAIYSSNDDYSGKFLTGPVVPKEFTNVISGNVRIGKHVIIGAGCVVLPNVVINDGAAVGALTLVKRDVDAFSVVGGDPVRVLKKRETNLIKLERELKGQGIEG